MKLMINTEGVAFFCTRAPEARTDRESGAARLDRETGLPLWQVQVAALDSTGGEVLAITVVGQPAVAVGSAVAVDNLVAIPWTQGDRSGVAYRASALRTASGAIPGAHSATGAERPAGTTGNPAGKPGA
ncbi:hypothetical protein QN345_00100 [Cryobacterium sp. 10I1]|uniref:hypothetical protein n=1 Tax=unclassified Cryobacterium TaxID=2649013 RepID=UPI002AC966E8|nr:MULTISPECIES: hypothetical protein [unclassified Cryobacterium]MEB0286768.1 hypothetical protein [Cryobacterium sp. 10S3]MEB0303739.1 hypothetical protein [Cryobacterium sp. 10I1]WPX12682.1 hypothetical protein RHM57_13480 [Cryobacterium sp. 10S3]